MQKAVILMMDERFVAEIDAAYPRLGYSDRATFIRDAVLKEMKKNGYDLPIAYKAAPPRTGKGGRSRSTETKQGKARKRA
jgi:hypothetical protein